MIYFVIFLICSISFVLLVFTIDFLKKLNELIKYGEDHVVNKQIIFKKGFFLVCAWATVIYILAPLF